jgi:(p)ppGpp synthase/HD superfamily hydrolase
MQIAQTNIQLYNQLRRGGFELDDLVSVHRSYEFLTTLYPGHYQPDGKPFVAHAVGVASVLAGLDQPADLVVVGLLHNVYGNGDFGDGRESGVTQQRRELIRYVVGERIEQLLVRFTELRIRPANVEERRSSLADLDETDRRLMFVDLADYLEKYVDLGLLYFGDGEEIFHTTELIGDDLIQIARELGEPRLAQMLASHFGDLAAQAQAVPTELRASDGRKHVKLVAPRSCHCREDSPSTYSMSSRER